MTLYVASFTHMNFQSKLHFVVENWLHSSENVHKRTVFRRPPGRQ